MTVSGVLLAMAAVLQAAESGPSRWAPFTSREGNFVVDFPGKPKTFTRAVRTRVGQVRIVVAQVDTPDVLYTAEKVEQPMAAGLKPADLEAILDYWRDQEANEFNGKVVSQKK